MKHRFIAIPQWVFNINEEPQKNREKHIFTPTEVWLDLFKLAQDNRETAKQSPASRQEYTAGQGEIQASCRTLAERWGWTKDKVHRWVKKQIGLNRLSAEKRNGKTVFRLDSPRRDSNRDNKCDKNRNVCDTGCDKPCDSTATNLRHTKSCFGTENQGNSRQNTAQETHDSATKVRHRNSVCATVRQTTRKFRNRAHGININLILKFQEGSGMEIKPGPCARDTENFPSSRPSEKFSYSGSLQTAVSPQPQSGSVHQQPQVATPPPTQTPVIKEPYDPTVTLRSECGEPIPPDHEERLRAMFESLPQAGIPISKWIPLNGTKTPLNRKNGKTPAVMNYHDRLRQDGWTAIETAFEKLKQSHFWKTIDKDRGITLQQIVSDGIFHKLLDGGYDKPFVSATEAKAETAKAEQERRDAFERKRSQDIAIGTQSRSTVRQLGEKMRALRDAGLPHGTVPDVAEVESEFRKRRAATGVFDIASITKEVYQKYLPVITGGAQ